MPMDSDIRRRSYVADPQTRISLITNKAQVCIWPQPKGTIYPGVGLTTLLQGSESTRR